MAESSGLAGEKIAPEASDSPAAIEPQVAATMEGGEALETSSEKNALLVPSAGGHETTIEAYVLAVSQEGGGATEAPGAADAFARPREVISHDGPNFSGGDPTSFEVKLERFLVDMVESGVEASGTVALVAAITVGAVETSDQELALEGVEAERPRPILVSIVRAPGDSTTVEVAEANLRSPRLGR
jgi:hypothetical protein